MPLRIQPEIDPNNPRSVAEGAVELCRMGEWERGLQLLGNLVKERGISDTIPGLAYSYLGYGVARFNRQVKEGLRLCGHAVKAEYYHPDVHLNLARVHVLARNRKGAVAAIQQGLALDPRHAELRALQKEVGVRRRPVVGFLARENPVNKTLGRLRHELKGSKK